MTPLSSLGRLRSSLADCLLLAQAKAVLPAMSLAKCLSTPAVLLAPSRPPREQHPELPPSAAMCWNSITHRLRKRKSMPSSIYRLVNGRNSNRRWPSKLHVQPLHSVEIANVSSATPVPFGRGRGKPVNVPDHPPPPGYLCYRCREKGKGIASTTYLLLSL